MMSVFFSILSEKKKELKLSIINSLDYVYPMKMKLNPVYHQQIIESYYSFFMMRNLDASPVNS